MQIMFKYTKNNLEAMFVNASDLRWTWFTKDGISDTISFCPNKIKILSPTIKEKKGLINLFLMMKFLSFFLQKFRFKSFRTFKYDGSHHLR